MFTLYAFSSDRILLNPDGIDIECDHLPRVGEIITIKEDWLPEEHGGSFIIFDVYHEIIGTLMITFVQAISGDEESRRQILRARGWFREK